MLRRNKSIAVRSHVCRPCDGPGPAQVGRRSTIGCALPGARATGHASKRARRRLR